jgi:hypothetical protein
MLDFIARVWNKRGAARKSRRQKAEDRRQKTEDRRQKTEDRRQKTEGRRQQHLEGSVDSSWSQAASRLMADG